VYRNILIFILMFFFSFFVQIETARAAPQLDVKAEVGVNNTIKLYEPLPLKLTITNNGSAFSGDLVIDASVTFAAGSALVYPLDLAEGETKTLTIYVDGFSDDYLYSSQNESLFTFYEGGIEKGKVVDFTGDKKPRFRHFLADDSIFIFTYTENSDRLAALLRLKQYLQNENIEIFHLNQLPGYEFPEDYKGFAMADLFIVDELSIADLPKKTQEALFEWVEKGGTLLVGASEQVERSMGIFSSHLPLNLTSEKTIVTQEALNVLSKGGIFTEGIEVFRATEREGSQRILADGDTLLASSMDLGQGKIIQTTFSLGDQPLSTMDGYGKLLNEMLQLQTTFSKWSRGNYLDSLSYELGSFNELFPSFKVNTFIVLITIILYMFLVGPVLYLLLKKLDKREHAWWLIPVISIVLTLAIFLIGAKERILQSQINQSAFYKVNGNNLSGYYVESILTNRNGDFVFTMDEHTSGYATRDNDFGVSGRLHEKSYIKKHGDGSSIHLRNLNYWSVQSIIGETTIPDAGNFDIDLTVTESRIHGTVKNNFPFAVKDATIWSGSQEIKIGDIQPNETVKINKKLNSSILLKPVAYATYWDEPRNVEELIPKRIEQLKYQSVYLIDENHPVLIGWVEDPLVGIQLDGNAEVNPISVILQEFQPKMEIKGEFKVNDSMMEMWVYPVDDGYAELTDELSNEYLMSPGDYEFQIVVPEELLNEKYQLKEIKIRNREKNNLTMSIWNFSTSTYEEIQDREWAIKENLQHYISENREIKMLLKVGGDQDVQIHLPALEIKGVAKE